MKDAITKAVVDRALASRGERYDVTDSRQPGLTLRVNQSGASWAMRVTLDGKARRLVLGLASEMSIEVARAIGGKVMAATKANIVPDFRFVEELRLGHGIGQAPAVSPPLQGRATWTYEEARDAYLESVGKRLAVDTVRDYRHTLCNPRIAGPLAGRLLSEIDVRMVAKAIQAVHDDGSERLAEKALVVLRTMWKWASHPARQDLSGVEVNVLKLLEKPGRTKRGRKKARRPSIDACARLVAACRLGVFPPAQAYAIELLVLTAQRRRSVTLLRPDQIEPRDVWMIPGDSTKKGDPHPIPLTARMKEIVGAARHTMSGGWLFPATRVRRIGDKHTHIHGSTVTHAVTDFLVDASPHDIRRAFTTTINSRPIGSIKTPKLVLDHREGRTDVTGEHYDQAEYLPEKTDMLECWSATLEPLIAKHLTQIDVDEAKAAIRAAEVARKTRTGRGRSRKPKPRPTYDADAIRRHEMDEKARLVLDFAERSPVRGV